MFGRKKSTPSPSPFGSLDGGLQNKADTKKSKQRQEKPKEAKALERTNYVRKTGTLALIGGLLVGSAVIRAGIGATEVWAATDPQGEDIFAADGSSDQRNGDNNHPGACVTEEDIGPLLNTLRARESKIEEQETEIAFRMKTLETAKVEVEKRLAALVEAEDKLSATIAKAATAAEDDLSQLTTVYEQMKPKQAAALFEEMDPEFAAGFLGRMRPDSASSILAGMTPTAAYTISVMLAGRNADVPTE